jgi:hypothetical protein
MTDETEVEFLRKENNQLRNLMRRFHTATKQFYETPKTVKADNCPYKQILGLYKDIMWNFPECRKLTNKRKVAMRRRWAVDLTSLGDWEAYFKDAATKRFLMGNNDRKWKADFDFFLREDVIVKMQEGKYDG